MTDKQPVIINNRKQALADRLDDLNLLLEGELKLVGENVFTEDLRVSITRCQAELNNLIVMT